MPDDGLGEALGDLQVRGGFLLVDLSQIDDAEIAAASLGAHAQLGLLLLKHAPSLQADRFWGLFATWARTLGEIAAMDGGRSRLVALLNYIGEVVGTPSRDELNIIAAELSEPAAEGVVTWAEALRQEGIEQGIEQGIETGVQTGIEKGVRMSLLSVLELRFGSLPAGRVAQIEAAGVAELEAWLARAVTAPSLERVLGD